MHKMCKSTPKKAADPLAATRQHRSGFLRWLTKRMFRGDQSGSVGGGRTTAADDTKSISVPERSPAGDHGYSSTQAKQTTKTVNVTCIQAQKIIETNALCGFKDLRRPDVIASSKRAGRVKNPDWLSEFQGYYNYTPPQLEDVGEPATLVKYQQDAAATYIATPPRKFNLEAAIRPYHIREQLGVGSQGVVFSVTKAGQKFVAKLASKGMFTKMTMNEFILIKDLRHCNIVRALGPLKGGFLMEFVDTNLCSLFECSDPSSDQKHRIVKGILKGLSYMHSQGIAHLDIKLENILVTKRREAKIADFGLSARFHTRTGEPVKLHRFLGTVPYMAPELLRLQHNRSRGVLMPPLDIWACGCLVYEILTRELPFGNDTVNATQFHHRRMSVSGLTVPADVEAEMWDSEKAVLLFTVVQKILQILPGRRPSAAHIVRTYFR